MSPGTQGNQKETPSAGSSHLGPGMGACIPAETAGRRLFPSAAEHAVNSVVVLVFCLFPWNGLMDVNNYQTIKASKCAIFYRSKSSNK